MPHTDYLRLDVDETKKPDIVSDIHTLEWEAGSFDTVIAIEVLSFGYR